VVPKTETKNITEKTMHFGTLGAVISGEMLAITIQVPRYKPAVVVGFVRYQFFDYLMKKVGRK
jgi:hypothetical protein